MTANKIKEINVDAVILWVDGSDDVYKTNIYQYLKKEGNHKKSFNNRYNQVNEIEYTVNSIIKHASFVRNIFIVTDNQIPNFLKNSLTSNKYANVKIIDHSIIFKDLESNLPTFNSRTIETCLHKIPKLSEHFIYLNDDFFIINPTTKKDFFTENGYPILRGMWQKFDKKILHKKVKIEKAGHKKAQEKAAKMLNFKKLYRFKHTPHPIRKSTLINFFDKNPNYFLNNIKYKFRNSKQFLPVALANHIEIKNKTCFIKKDLELLYFRSYKKPLIWYRCKLTFVSKNKLFLGLQSLNKSPENTLKYILNWLTNRMR